MNFITPFYGFYECCSTVSRPQNHNKETVFCYLLVLRSSWFSFNQFRKNEKLKTLVMNLEWLMKYCQDWSIYSVFIYNSFTFNSFLTFLLLLIFIYVVLRFKLAFGHLCGKIEELYMPGQTSLTCFGAKVGETAGLGKFYLLICCIPYTCCFFRFDASLLRLFVIYDSVFFFIWLSYCKGLVLLSTFRYSDKVYLFIRPLNYCSLHKTHFALQHWQPYFFHDYSYQEYSLFFRLLLFILVHSLFLSLSAKYVNLIFWLEVFVAFNDQSLSTMYRYTTTESL